jgi:hypothetical protein
VVCRYGAGKHQAVSLPAGRQGFFWFFLHPAQKERKSFFIVGDRCLGEGRNIRPR